MALFISPGAERFAYYVSNKHCVQNESGAEREPNAEI
jgi:hypothetical protein